MAIPVAFTEARDKLQRTRQQGDRATQGVQRKPYAPVGEVVQFRGKGYVRQQVTKSLQRIHKSEERQQDPQDFRQRSHVALFCHASSRCAAHGLRVLQPPTANLNNFPGLDFLEGQDQGRKVLAQVFQAIGG